MSKKIKYTIWVFFIVILLILVFLAVTIKKNANLINKAAQPANQTQQANQAQQASQQASQQAAQQAAQQAKQKIVPPAPVYTKEVKVEFMTDAEKLTMSLPAALKIQVLERDKTGKVTAYKIIRQDSDIMTKYGN
ncbi:MAG: hypothetical protein ACYC40_01650 [Patescibacteria group bacterium]